MREKLEAMIRTVGKIEFTDIAVKSFRTVIDGSKFLIVTEWRSVEAIKQSAGEGLIQQ